MFRVKCPKSVRSIVFEISKTKMSKEKIFIGPGFECNWRNIAIERFHWFLFLLYFD